MKKILIHTSLFCFLIILYSCSSSETVTYNVGGNENWKINVIHNTGATDKFIVIINDSTLIAKTANVVTGKLEEIGKYREREIKLVVSYEKDEYRISGGFKALVFIENKLAAKFDF
jgi:hypothetical protein